MHILQGVSKIVLLSSFAVAAYADPFVYNNLLTNGLFAITSGPTSEAADDFVLTSQTTLTSAAFIGLIVPGTGGSPSITDVTVEIYRVFPLDSNAARTPNVPTRVNSPSDVDFASRDSAAAQLTFISSILTTSFTSLNSVAANGIHPSPNQTTLGNGPITGQEVQISVNFTSPITLDANHYFFVPTVTLSNGASFYWLSASRPIVAPGTPFPAGFTDLQAWVRNDALEPDWLRVGTDIVGGTTPPTFNAAFLLNGTTTAVPEPSTIVLSAVGLLAIAARKLRRAL